MNNLVFLDSAWKCLVTLTVSTTVIFAVSLLIYSLIKRVTPGEKSKRFFNYHILFTIFSIVFGSIILTYIDPNFIARCFDHFAAASNAFTITRTLAGCYLVVLAVLLVADSAKFIISARRHKAFAKIEDHPINEILTILIERLNLKKPFEVLSNENATSPYVWGLMRHQIVVNEFLLKNEDKKQIETILAHELMHIKGNDSVWLLLSHIAKRVFFFNPISYLFYSKHRLAVEIAADENAIEQCRVEPQTLMKSILEIAEHCTERQDYLLQVNASQEFTEIKERIKSMMDKRKKRVTWVYPAFSFSSLMLSLIVTTVQTNASVGSRRINSDVGEFMCPQIRHEKVIEDWLRMESPPNKSEMK